MRGGKLVHLKKVVNEAVNMCSCVKHVVLFRKSGEHVLVVVVTAELNRFAFTSQRIMLGLSCFVHLTDCITRAIRPLPVYARRRPIVLY